MSIYDASQIPPVHHQRATTNTSSGSRNQYDVWSLVTVTYKDPALPQRTLNLKVSPSIAKHIAQEMRDTGFCHLFSGNQAILIAASEIQSIEFTKLTTEENP